MQNSCSMMRAIILGAVLLAFGVEGGSAQPAPNTVMLILGSANPETLEKRVEVGLQLYRSEVEFDKIIVSGGCGAHDSSICEANRMDSLLQLNGVPAAKIIKEEKSHSTKQNYCYSKRLKVNGVPIIRKNTRLYVVSTHWHAIPVAACFRTAGGVKQAKYHVEGALAPSGPADYTHIFKYCGDSNYCRSILWAYIDTAYFNSATNKLYYFVDDIYYRLTPGEGVDEGYPKPIDQYPGWPAEWEEAPGAAYFSAEDQSIYLFKGEKVVRYAFKEGNGPGAPQPVTQHFKHWPDQWDAGYIDAAYFNPEQNRLYLFKGDEFATYSGSQMIENAPADITESYAVNWPFQWGSGDLNAAWYHPSDTRLFLSRGTSFLQLSLEDKAQAMTPGAISLPWPEELWGARPQTN